MGKTHSVQRNCPRQCPMVIVRHSVRITTAGGSKVKNQIFEVIFENKNKKRRCDQNSSQTLAPRSQIKSGVKITTPVECKKMAEHKR